MYMNNGRSPRLGAPFLWGCFVWAHPRRAYGGRREYGNRLSWWGRLDALEFAAAGGAAVAPGVFDQLAHAVPADDRAAFLTAEEVLHLLPAEGGGVPFQLHRPGDGEAQGLPHGFGVGFPGRSVIETPRAGVEELVGQGGPEQRGSPKTLWETWMV